MSKTWAMGKVVLALTVVLTMSRMVPWVHGQEMYTVTNTNDSGAGSLRWAIEQANANAGTDTINFAISGGGIHTIPPTSALPVITEPVIINGLSQEGASCASWPPTQPTLLIELNGTNAGSSSNGLSVAAGGSGSMITGLIINRFTRAGIRLEGGGDNTITCNYVGTDSTGMTDLGNNLHGIHVVDSTDNIIAGNLISGNGSATSFGSGVRIVGSTATGNLIQGNYIGLQADGAGRLDNTDSGVYIQGAPNNTIGGDTEAARNVISGNTLSGVSIFDSGATGNVVQGNYIGTRANGTEALHNTWSGVYIVNSPNNTIGGTTAGARNILSGNSFFGVYISGSSATGNLVQGNYIGTGINGTGNLGNSGHGIYILSGASGNQIGGPSENESNLITHNGRDGVYVASGANNLISRNSISSNSGLGIDLETDGVTPNDLGDGDTGANNLQNFPVLTSVTLNGSTTNIVGTLNSAANTTYQLEFFYSTAADSTSYGEGQSFLGSASVTTDGSGNATVNESFGSIPAGSYVSATATDPSNNTSEFSYVFQAPTAVTLQDFQARPIDRHIMLEWTTATEIDNLGFNLYRAEAPDVPQGRLNGALIPVQVPGSPVGATYTWQDEQVSPGVTYYYWLEDVDVYGVTTLHGPVSAVVPSFRYYLPLVNR